MYLCAGVQTVIVAHPELKDVLVRRPDGSSRTFAPGQRFSEESPPGFEVDTTEIFAGL
jgi:hypothetical protein